MTPYCAGQGPSLPNYPPGLRPCPVPGTRTRTDYADRRRRVAVQIESRSAWQGWVTPPARHSHSPISGDQDGGLGADRERFQGPISNSGGSRLFRHPVFGAAGVSKNETVISWAHFDVANTTCGS